jgi:hypothetical protein
MRQAAIDAVRSWRFAPATLDGGPVRYFAPSRITFDGLPPESRSWSHRALFDLQTLVFDSAGMAAEAARRLRAGEPVDDVAPGLALDSEWGLVGAAGLPAPLRKALHEAMLGQWTGPVAAEDRHFLARKHGEVYYGILPGRDAAGDLQYRIVYQRGIPDGAGLRQAIDADIRDFSAERRRRDYMNEAARLMGIRQDRVEVGRLVIRTDVLTRDESSLLGEVVNAALRAHQDFWAGLVALRPFREQVLVYAFARRSEHERLARLWSAGGREPAASAGEYLPASRILAFPCDQTAGHLPVPIAIHEAIHMLDYERVYAPRVRPSPWFEEGLANYFGFSQITSQLRIDPGDIRRSGTIVLGSVTVQFDPRAELREHLRLSRDEGPFPLSTLIAAGPGDPLWSGERAPRAYGAAWTLVHYLLHGDKGRRAEAFRRYAAREARGEGGPGAFRDLFGPDLAALEAGWHAYEETL